MVLFRNGKLFSFQFFILKEIKLKRVNIIVEPERSDGPYEIVAIDGLPLLPLALIGRFTSDEADELRYAFLNGFLGVFRHFTIAWNGLLHDSAYICYGEKSILISVVAAAAAVANVFGIAVFVVV